MGRCVENEAEKKLYISNTHIHKEREIMREHKKCRENKFKKLKSLLLYGLLLVGGQPVTGTCHEALAF